MSCAEVGVLAQGLAAHPAVALAWPPGDERDDDDDGNEEDEDDVDDAVGGGESEAASEARRVATADLILYVVADDAPRPPFRVRDARSRLVLLDFRDRPPPSSPGDDSEDGGGPQLLRFVRALVAKSRGRILAALPPPTVGARGGTTTTATSGHDSYSLVVKTTETSRMCRIVYNASRPPRPQRTAARQPAAVHDRLRLLPPTNISPRARANRSPRSRPPRPRAPRTRNGRSRSSAC